MAEEGIFFSFIFTVLSSPVLLLLKNLLHVFLVFFIHKVKGCGWIKLVAPSLKATKFPISPLCHFFLLYGQMRDTVKEENKEVASCSL
jgi:hypothetical protein